MYSRSERKFLNPEKDQANPNLGPGCYTRDDPVLVSGKRNGSNGYAPFASLSPRISFFDQQIKKGPPPGNYDLSFGIELTHKSDGASLFGRSRAQRFKNSSSEAPGPDTYKISSTIRVPSKAEERKEKIPVGFGLNQRPIAIEELNTGDVEKISSHAVAAEEPNLTGKSTQNHSKAEIDIDQSNGMNIVPPMALFAKKVVTRQDQQTTPNPDGQSNAHKNIKSLIWRRKHIAPSIPVGTSVYGYQENQDGELEPRKPPKLKKDDPPSFLFSFVELSKHKKRGHAFAKGRQRLTFKTSENPGPNSYDPQSGEEFLRSNNAALITLAPCRRVTDDIIISSTKQGIPGPGAYDIKAPIAAKLAEPRNRIRFGAGKGTGYLNPDLMKVPGPGAYYPEIGIEKPQSKKLKPFGSSTKRFQDMEVVTNQPAVGSYEIDEIDSIYQNAKKKNTTFYGQPKAVFGSIADRFVEQKPIIQPGPGAYDIDQSRSKNPKHSKIVLFGFEKKVSNVEKISLPFHTPVFGSQTDRFEDKIPDNPPPGAYDVSESFTKVMESKSRAGLLSSQAKREIFKVNQNIPGPGEYSVKLESRIQSAAGAFLSTESRFTDKYEKLPGPGAYSKEDSSLVKKSYNVSFQEERRIV